jgi:hypothetical protein
MLSGKGTTMTRKNAPSTNERAQPKTDLLNNNLSVGVDLLWQAYCYARDVTYIP